MLQREMITMFQLHKIKYRLECKVTEETIKTSVNSQIVSIKSVQSPYVLREAVKK